MGSGSMTFGEVVQRTWRENLLFSVLLELTYRCNLDCFFCYNDLGLRGEPLSRERWLALLAELAELQVFHLTLTGGEPLAHPEFFAIGGRARELGFAVRVKSNGHALRGEMARRLRDEVDPFLVEVSLHGATAATHDRQTRVAGSFVRLLANLREALALGLRLKLNSTLTRWNEGEIEGMLALADELGVPLQIDPQVTPKDDGDREPLSIAATPEGLARLFALQEAAVAAARAGETASRPAAGAAGGCSSPQAAATPPAVDRHCGAGAAGAAIDPFGNVYPCVQWRRPLGSLHRQTMREIWESSPALAAVRDTTRRALGVVADQGELGGLMAFCPGNAEALTGDPLAIYPEAAARAAAHLAARSQTASRLPIVR
jgi:MoaA/NifB/PqqE/SkfB family radical SAM enzyme